VAKLDFELLRSKSADILYIVFSGHGDHRYINLNEHQRYDTEKFEYLNSKNLLTIIDACRAYLSVDSFQGIGDIFTEEFDKSNLKEARKIYDTLLQKYQGKAFIHSCSKGELSYTDSYRGGHYTYSLLQSILDWHNMKRGPALSAFGAYQMSLETLNDIGNNTQNPEMFYVGNGRKLPFAINSTVRGLRNNKIIRGL
jgi:hypothetical protein